MEIYLEDLKRGSYKKFEETFKNLKEEFDKRNIKIGKWVSIGDETYIGVNVTIGDDVTIGYSAYIFSDVTIDDNVSIGNGVCINDDIKNENPSEKLEIECFEIF